MITLFLYQLFLYICSIFIVYSIGKCISSFFKIDKNIIFRLFIIYIVGISTILLFYSVLKSQGKTISIFLIPILIYLIYRVKEFKTKATFSFLECRNELLLSIAPFIAIFLFHCYFFFDFQSNFLKPLNTDYYLYATFSDSLKLWGTENIFTSVNYFNPSYQSGVMPYHYPELWITAFFSLLFNNSTITTYALLTSSLLIGIFAIGIASLLSRIFKNQYWAIILSLPMLGISGLFFQFYNSFNSTDIEWYSGVSVIGYSGVKFVYSYIFILLAFIVFTETDEFLGIILLSIIPLFSVGLLPGIWGGIIIYYALKILISKFKVDKSNYIILFIILAELIGYYLFYRTFGISYTDKYAASHIKSVLMPSQEYLWQSIKNILGNSVIYWFRILLFYFPFFFLFIITKTNTIKNWLLVSCILFCAAFTTTVSYGLTDAGQFVSNIGVLFVVIIIYDIAKLWEKTLLKESWYLKSISLIVCVMIVFLCIKSVSKKQHHIIPKADKNFINKVASKIKRNDKSPIIVFYSTEQYVNSISIRDVYGTLDDQLRYLHEIINLPIIPVMGNISEYKKLKQLTYADSFYYAQLTPLPIWESKKKGNNLENFVTKHNITQFYFMNNVEIPSWISDKRKIEIIKSDVSNAKFILRY